eukprot:8241167-Alexandrium_andersonii.AAC.1
MEARFLRKVEGGLGGGKSDLEEARLLSRVIRWASSGYPYEAGPTHAGKLVRDLLSVQEGASAVTFL